MLTFKAAILPSQKVEAEKPEGMAPVMLRNKISEQNALFQESSRKQGGIFFKYFHLRGPKEGRQELKVGKMIKWL